MSLPISLSLLTVEIRRTVLSDTEPTPEAGYEVVLLKDVGYTRLWIEFKVG